MSQRVLEFVVGSEYFAVDLLEVQEVIPPPKLTTLPSPMASFLGMTDLRSELIPIFDLHTKLGIKSTCQASEPGVVIVKVENLSIGLAVDKIEQVLFLSEENFTSDPIVLGQVSAKYAKHVHQTDEHITVMLDIKSCFSIKAIAAMSQRHSGGRNCKISA